jgi:putative SOS response-associated peptidase YedK
MCGRYTLDDVEDLRERFNLTAELRGVTPNYNAAPGQYMPIITKKVDGNQEDVMRWGLIPSWTKDIKIGYKLINTVSETAFDKPIWRSAITHYRCLVPSTGFYEWKLDAESKTKRPFFIHPKDQELFAFAGLWSTWKDVEKKEIKSFSILTTQPNREMAVIHNRMPVILRPDEESTWLDPSLTDRGVIEKILHPYQDNGLDIHEVSRDVNSPKNNRADLVKPVTTVNPDLL